MKNVKLFVFAALVLVMVVAACGGGGAAVTQPAVGTSPTSIPISGTQPTATAAVRAIQATSVPTSVAPTAEVVPTAEELELGSVTEALSQLKSYKSQYVIHFIGKDAQGQALEKSFDFREEFILEPRAQRLVWSSTESKAGQAAETSSYENVTIGTTSYMITQDVSGEATCITISSSDATLPEQSLSPDAWAGMVSGSKYLNTETVNGVTAKHYAWNAEVAAAAGWNVSKAETWVAVDTGVVVKQVIEGTGQGVLFASSDEEGTTTMQYDVTDINGSFEILPPEGCESASTDIPVMADATEKSTYGDTVMYTSATAFADVVAFYKTEMPNAGWAVGGDSMETESYAMLNYTKDTRTASVMISFDESNQKTSVMVTVTKE